MLGCGISHPCATFDRWRAMPLVDDDYNVLGAVRTFF
jgi:D-serine dehydratase